MTVSDVYRKLAYNSKDSMWATRHMSASKPIPEIGLCTWSFVKLA